MLPAIPRRFKNKKYQALNENSVSNKQKKTMKQVKFSPWQYWLKKFSLQMHKNKTTKVTAANNNNPSLHTISYNSSTKNVRGKCELFQGFIGTTEN